MGFVLSQIDRRMAATKASAAATPSKSGDSKAVDVVPQVVFVGSIPSEIMDALPCAICHEIPLVPLASDCGHILCRSCLNGNFAVKNYKCPTCRKPVSEADFKAWLPQTKMMGALKVFCPLHRLQQRHERDADAVDEEHGMN